MLSKEYPSRDNVQTSAGPGFYHQSPHSSTMSLPVVKVSAFALLQEYEGLVIFDESGPSKFHSLVRHRAAVVSTTCVSPCHHGVIIGDTASTYNSKGYSFRATKTSKVIFLSGFCFLILYTSIPRLVCASQRRSPLRYFVPRDTSSIWISGSNISRTSPNGSKRKQISPNISNIVMALGQKNKCK